MTKGSYRHPVSRSRSKTIEPTVDYPTVVSQSRPTTAGSTAVVRGKLQRNRERITARSVNDNQNRDLKSAAISASTRPGPVRDFCVARVEKGIRPTSNNIWTGRALPECTCPQLVVGGMTQGFNTRSSCRNTTTTTGTGFPTNLS